MTRALLTFFALVSCKPVGVAPAPVLVQAGDTLRGTLIVEGSAPFPIYALRSAAGRVVIDSADASLLKVDHLDVWLRGTRTSADRFRVSDYRVRSANGAVAWDGILRGDSGNLRLDLDDGSSHAIRSAPAGLERLVGSRIWFTENPDGSMREYGVL